jgi:predicted DNA-binding transcriptional regulator YafY
MPFRAVLADLERIDTLIRLRSTGTPDQMAEKLGISRATWFRWLEQLTDDLGLPIDYDEYRKTYYYTKRGWFVVKFVEEKTEAEAPTYSSTHQKLTFSNAVLPYLMQLSEQMGGFVLEIL